MSDRRHDAMASLSAREKETLRLLLGGHDAKSIARDLGLSVHTVNERLRDARRKLGVSSSREAARLLAQSEGASPKTLGDKEIGVASRAADATGREQLKRRQFPGSSLAWLGGGMLIMLLIIAAVALSPAFHGSDAVQAPPAAAYPIAAAPSDANEPANGKLARAWVALVDNERWAESWSAASTLFQAQVTQDRWTTMVQGVRQALGRVSTRTFKAVTRTASLPGAPAGEYEIIQFQTTFANKQDAAENVVLMREGAGWKVAGYFIL